MQKFGEGQPDPVQIKPLSSMVLVLYVYYIYKYLCFVRCGASLCLRGVSHCAIDLHSNEIMSYSDLNDNLFGLGVGLSFGGVSPCEP